MLAMVRSEGVVLYARVLPQATFQPLFAVPLFQFGQTSAGLVALLGGLTGLQEVFGYLLGASDRPTSPSG